MDQSETVAVVEPAELFVELRDQTMVERLAVGLLADFLASGPDTSQDSSAPFENELPFET